MRLFSFRTKRLGVVAGDWWWPEAGLVVWIGGEIVFKLWGSRCGFRHRRFRLGCAAGFVGGLLIAAPSWAQQTTYGQSNSRNPPTMTPASPTGSVSSVTIGTSSAQAIASEANGRRLLSIDNESATATIACSMGGTAALNAAGSFTIPPGMTRTWSGTAVPADAVNCISDTSSTPATIQSVPN